MNSKWTENDCSLLLNDVTCFSNNTKVLQNVMQGTNMTFLIPINGLNRHPFQTQIMLDALRQHFHLKLKTVFIGCIAEGQPVARQSTGIRSGYPGMLRPSAREIIHLPNEFASLRDAGILEKSRLPIIKPDPFF